MSGYDSVMAADLGYVKVYQLSALALVKGCDSD